MEKRPAIFDQILLNRPIRIILTLTLCAIVAPVMVYVTFYSRELGYPDGIVIGTCGHSEVYQVPCGTPTISREMCATRGCCFSERFGCYHYYPSQYQYTTFSSLVNAQTINAPLMPLRKMTTLGETSERLQFRLTEVSDSRLKIELGMSIPPGKTVQTSAAETSTLRYKYKIDNPAIIIRVSDKENDRLLLTSSRGPLIASERYFEWTLHLGSDILLGLGDLYINQRPFKKLLVINEKDNVVPYILAYDAERNSFHAITFKGYGPIEVEITRSSLVIFRLMSSRLLSVELMMGPTLGDVLQQIGSVVGIVRSTPAYWTLGMHICRIASNSNVTESVQMLSEFMNTTNQMIPFDSHCIQEDLMLFGVDSLKYNEYLNSSIQLLQDNSKKFVFSVVSQLEVNNVLSYERAVKNSILLRNDATELPYEGVVGETKVTYVDWTNGGLGMENWLSSYFPYDIVSRADQMLLQNNCLRDDSANITRLPSRSLYQYIPEGLESASQNLTPSNLRLSWKPNESHSLLPFLNKMSTTSYVEWMQEQLSQNVPIVVTKWNSVGNDYGVISSRYEATWSNLQQSFKDMLIESIAGIRIAGSVACGSIGAVPTNDEELCVRWYQLASVSPMLKVYADRTPEIFTGYSRDMMVFAIRRRYSLLAYYNTILLLTDLPIIRPLFYHYADLLMQREIQTEVFMLGQAIIVAPVLYPAVMNKYVFMPEDGYELWGGNGQKSGWSRFWVVQKDLPIFVMAGHVIPLHDSKVSMSAMEARQEPLTLVIALKCIDVTSGITPRVATCSAQGTFAISKTFYWIFNADQTKVTLSFSTQPVRSEMCAENADVTTSISKLKVYGLGNQTLVSTIDFNLCKNSTILSSYLINYQ